MLLNARVLVRDCGGLWRTAAGERLLRSSSGGCDPVECAGEAWVQAKDAVMRGA